jgi:calpain-15
VQIRNPWGKFEWKGEFSDDSNLWTPEDRQELNVQRANDGIFWMPLENFVKYFQGVGILEILPGAVTNGIAV